MAELAIEPEARQKLTLVGLVLLGTVTLLLLVVFIANRDIVRLTALVAVIGFVGVFPFPKQAVVLIILFAQVQYLFTTYYGSLVSHPIFPRSFQWLDEVMLLSLLGNLTLSKLRKGKGAGIEKAPGLAMLIVLFMIGLASARLNGVGLKQGLIGQRYIFQMVILYLAIINMDLDERYLKGLIYLLLGIGFFQAIVGILEFVSKYRLYVAGNHDVVQGTWGGGSSNFIGVFALCLSAIVLASLRRRWHGPKAILFGSFVFLLVLSSCRSGIVVSPFVFLFVLREKMKNPKYWIGATVALVFLLASLALYYKNTDAEIERYLGTDEFVFQIMGRTRVIPVMSQVLHDNSKFPPFGAGPSTYVPATGDIFGSRMYIQIESMLRTHEVIHPFISASYAVVWMEYGMVGLVLFAMILVRLFLFAWQREKSARSLFWKDYFRALQAIIFVYVVVGGIFPLWTHFQTNIYLWLFPAIGVKYAILDRERAKRESEAFIP